MACWGRALLSWLTTSSALGLQTSLSTSAITTVLNVPTIPHTWSTWKRRMPWKRPCFWDKGSHWYPTFVSSGVNAIAQVNSDCASSLAFCTFGAVVKASYDEQDGFREGGNQGLASMCISRVACQRFRCRGLVFSLFRWLSASKMIYIPLRWSASCQTAKINLFTLSSNPTSQEWNKLSAVAVIFCVLKPKQTNCF